MARSTSTAESGPEKGADTVRPTSPVPNVKQKQTPVIRRAGEIGGGFQGDGSEKDLDRRA